MDTQIPHVALTLVFPDLGGRCRDAAAGLPGFAQDAPRKIAIEIEGKAEFDVIYRRALTNATGAVLGGLIGAGIQAGIESNEDAEKRAAIYPYVAEQAWRDVFIKTMTDALAEKGLEPSGSKPARAPSQAPPTCISCSTRRNSGFAWWIRRA